MRDLQKLGVEDALMGSAPNSLCKRPDAREGFDTVILGTLTEFIAKFIKDVDEKLGENEAQITELDKNLEMNAEATEKALAESQEQSQHRVTAQKKQTGKAEALKATELALTTGRT